jgi:hypothetical protein
MNTYILCGGRQTRWGCGASAQRKHYVAVDGGELLIDRTLRLLASCDPHPVIISHEILAEEFSHLSPSGSIGRTCLEVPWGDGPVLFLMGDVFWTEEALGRLVISDAPVSVATDRRDSFGFKFQPSAYNRLNFALRTWDVTGRLRDALGQFEEILCADRTQDFDVRLEWQQFRVGLSKNAFLAKTPEQVALRKRIARKCRRLYGAT